MSLMWNDLITVHSYIQLRALVIDKTSVFNYVQNTTEHFSQA